ncbi:hypothetical protein RNJ44_00179 [Nakaseomyces bracarensis]|uniref:Essential for maintenance of the cell wall protein 1 n=1 Tax=Nakaseomyces bracarensis TaxID=273131 RepID=A0ABR4NTH8_9SACH
MDTLVHCHLLLASNPEVLDALTPENDYDARIFSYSKYILQGNSYRVVQDIMENKSVELPENISQDNVLTTLNQLLENLIGDQHIALLFAIASLQTFIQNNYTGPKAPIEIVPMVFTGNTEEQLQPILTALLSTAGQTAYELMDDPLLLVLSLLILEKLTNQPTLFGRDIEDESALITEIHENGDSLNSITQWWRARALLTQISVLPELYGVQPAIASSILDSINLPKSILNTIEGLVDEEFKKSLCVIYYLESVKCSLTINTEHRALPALTKVKKLTGFEFVLTGARAKRTKYQQKAVSGLIILAKSQFFNDSNDTESNEVPESLALNSDLLLEKPTFEAIANEPLDEQIVKRQKLDEDGFIEDKLLPVAIRQENIPLELQEVDPNEQPLLSNYDNIQLLLRLYTIRQTSPAKDPLVEEELGALVSRVIYQDGGKNWTIFSRSLWERSVIETTKAKTIERGILQMQSLVEELGLKIQTRLLPQSTEPESAMPRLKYIHQIPFIPRWELDATLAEKFMSLGILKSAVEIYERLQMSCQAALCYAAVGEEKTAEAILVKRIETHPNDARAYSLLGDVRQDPSLWEKSWEIGQYVNAKNSLARYYYRPPKDSGIDSDPALALKHLNDSLRKYTLNFNTWYFYGCIALECNQLNIAAEAFTRCTVLDPNHAASWSNLSAAYIQEGKLKEAYSCLKQAISSDSQKNWRIWENFLLVSVKLDEWEDVLKACKQLVEIKKDKSGEQSIDLPVVEKLVELLVTSEYPKLTEEGDLKFTYFQRSCMDFICNTLPNVITTDARCWKLVARVELWRKRPWAALESHEKAYRAISHNPDLEIDEKVWNSVVEGCEDLVAAYESLGEMEGKHGEGSLVCKDWKYKCRSTIKALMSRGKGRWDDSEGWEKLLELREQL